MLGADPGNAILLNGVMPTANPEIGVPGFQSKAHINFGIQVYARLASRMSPEMTFENYKIVLYRQDDGFWVAEIPAISGCYALMPTREQALEELNDVFQMISEEYREKGLALPADTTEIVHA
jgi:predicted RNase H-like HicB family nuclease